MDAVIPKANASILEDLYLDDCRITQNQEEHLKKWHWSMYAIDIACERWESFIVYTPNYFDKYEIEYIGIDKRLWNFIILRSWDYRFIYWHTETKLNIWDRLWKKQILGKTNISWMSENYHLHIELWKNDKNINWHKLNWWELEINPKSFDLRLQRWLVSEQEINQEILNFIALFEWCHLESYFDINHFSIWYGTKSYKWEKITQEEADKRARQVIQNIRDKYWLKDYSLDIQKALVSFVYNIWSLPDKMIWLLKNNYITALSNEILKYTKCWDKELWGLIKRRYAEFNLLN